MEHHDTSSEITFHHHIDEGEFKRRVRRTTILLSVITIIELGMGLMMYAVEGLPDWLILFLKGVIVILTLAKAYYIVSVFMHLGDEIRNMIMTIVVPLMLFIWFIAAFLWDGNSYKTNRNRYDTHKMQKTLDRKAEPADTSTNTLH